MKFRDRLFSYKDPYDLAGSSGLFAAAMQEACRYQKDHNPEYARLLEARGFEPSMITDEASLASLPVIPTAVFKKHKLATPAGLSGIIGITATSSGTSGSMSVIRYDIGTLWQALKMTIRVTARRRLWSLKPCNYVVFGYKPHIGNRTAVTKTATGATLFAPGLCRVYALKYVNGEYSPDLEGVIAAMQKFVKSRFPARFMGFPSYTYFVMKMMKDRGLAVKLPEGSLIMLGGGWKQFYREQVDKGEFYALAREVLGVPEENIVEFFGAAEHPILYCDCPAHHFHVPVYGRVVIRDVNTLEPLPEGQIGLVNLLTPLVKSAPLLSVMTDDLGVLHDGRNCPCGCSSPYLEIIGRVGMAEIKTCAAGADERLNAAIDAVAAAAARTGADRGGQGGTK